MQNLLTDARLAVRSLKKTPGFAAVALLTIALGVGANTAVFSVVNAVLLQPLPFPGAERLVAIYETAERATIERRPVSYPNYRDWTRLVRGADAMSPVSSTRFTMHIGDTPERVSGELVAASYFDMLGARPALGRVFNATEDAANAAAVVVISDGLWERAFNRDRGVLGRALRIEDRLTTIVGIMPPSFVAFNDGTELWAPIERFIEPSALESRGNRGIDLVIARLAPRVTPAQLDAELGAVARRLAQTHDVNRDRGAAVGSLRDEYFGDLRATLAVLLGAVGFVLLIACVNVANLLLARGSSRHREIAVRAALGARRGRIVRQLLTESLVLSTIGSAAGMLAAFWSIDLLVSLSPVSFPAFVRIEVDFRVLAFATAACVASALLFGIVPALVVSRTDLVTTLNAGGRGGTDARVTIMRRGLVAAEIALALVLLAGAGLMLRTLGHLSQFDPGFRPDGLLIARLMLPLDPDAESAAVKSGQFAETLIERARQLPSVADASIASDIPLGPSTSGVTVSIEGRDESIRIYRHAVSTGHFRTLGMSILEGRDFNGADARQAERPVLIVSRTMARRHWPGESALHKRMRFRDRLYEVVGIVGDVKHRNLIEADTADPDVYFPLLQTPFRELFVVMRVNGATEPAISGLRQVVRELDPNAPVFAVQTGEALIAAQTSRTRFSSALLGAFAIVALALTIVGIYGVTAYTVSRQARQVGIRIALGATPGDVLRLVLAGGVQLIIAGLTGGILAALALTRLLGSLIYGVSTSDPFTFAAVTFGLAGVAIAACVIPAARATRIDPAAALRAE
jgi:predicted permease